MINDNVMRKYAFQHLHGIAKRNFLITTKKNFISTTEIHKRHTNNWATITNEKKNNKTTNKIEGKYKFQIQNEVLRFATDRNYNRFRVSISKRKK